MTVEISTLEFVAGDTLPAIIGTIKDDLGVVVDISGYDIKLHIGYPTPLVKDATIPLGVDGVFQIAWGATDLVNTTTEAKTYLAEIQVTSPSGINTTQRTAGGAKLRIKIHPQIA